MAEKTSRPKTDALMSLKEAAEYLGVSPNSVRNYRLFMIEGVERSAAVGL